MTFALWFVLGFVVGALVVALVALWLSDVDNDEPEREHWTADDLYDSEDE